MNAAKDTFLDALKFGECPKCVGIATEPHPCPFSLEIHDDDTECNCCESCAVDCAMDI